MKINNQKFVIVIVGLLMIVSLIYVSNILSVKKTDRKIIFYTQCSSQEGSSDILNSSYKIKDQLKEMNISIVLDNKSNHCGYLLIDGNKKKEISGALTDIDLSFEIDHFYK